MLWFGLKWSLMLQDMVHHIYVLQLVNELWLIVLWYNFLKLIERNRNNTY